MQSPDSTSEVLVATSRQLLKVNIKTKQRTVISDQYGPYYGITWDEQHVYVATRWFPWYTLTARIERPRLLVFDATLKLVEKRRFPFQAGGLHQILAYEGKLYCSCSKQDSYLIRESDNWEEWYPSSDSAHHGIDKHHFNSIWFDKETMFLVGHNNGASEIWELTYPERRLIKRHPVGKYIHNVWREGNAITFCNSGEGKIETVDGAVLAETGDFPRGVVIAPDVNLVGISLKATRRLRAKTRGSIQIYSKNWKLLDTIDLGRCGQVCEIRSLHSKDLAHNGLSFPP